MKYNGFEYTAMMAPTVFESLNTEFFQQDRVERNPTLAFMINDWDTERYESEIDRDYVKGVMHECYTYRLDENF